MYDDKAKLLIKLCFIRIQPETEFIKYNDNKTVQRRDFGRLFDEDTALTYIATAIPYHNKFECLAQGYRRERWQQCWEDVLFNIFYYSSCDGGGAARWNNWNEVEANQDHVLENEGTVRIKLCYFVAQSIHQKVTLPDDKVKGFRSHDRLKSSRSSHSFLTKATSEL